MRKCSDCVFYDSINLEIDADGIPKPICNWNGDFIAMDVAGYPIHPCDVEEDEDDGR